MQRLTQIHNRLAGLLPDPGFTAFELNTLHLLHLSAFIILASVIYKFSMKDKNEREGLLPEKKREHFVATLTMTAAVLLMFILMNNRVMPFVIAGPLKWACYGLGLFFVAAGTGWHVWSKVSIGKFWSDQLELQKEHRIVTGGAYAFARHPMYGSLILWCLGLGLAAFNFGALLASGLVLIPMMIARARAEEELLAAVPGYEIYRNNVRMFFPTLSGAAGFAARLAALAIFVYAIITGISGGTLVFLLTIYLLLGNCLKPEKVAFSYRSKSFMMALVYVLSVRVPAIYYFYYFMAATFAYGLFFNCPCMLVYEKYHRCPCFDLLGKACGLTKR